MICIFHMLKYRLYMTMAGSEHGAPYCPLCVFPELPRRQCVANAARLEVKP